MWCPSGSVLGPSSFIAYVDDIFATSSISDVILFADDTPLLYSHSDIASTLTIVNRKLSQISCLLMLVNKLYDLYSTKIGIIMQLTTL